MGGRQSQPRADVHVVNSVVTKTTTTEFKWNDQAQAEAVDARKVKVVLIGARETGKSSLVRRWLHNAFETDPDAYVATEKVGIAAKMLHANGIVVNVEVWDVPGQAELRDVFLEDVLKGADAIFFVADPMRLFTFQEVSAAMRDRVAAYCELHHQNVLPLLALLVNKRDVQEAERREAPEGSLLFNEETYQTTAASLGCERAFYVSAAADIHVDEAFDWAVAAALRRAPRVWEPASPAVVQKQKDRAAAAAAEAAEQKLLADAARAAEEKADAAELAEEEEALAAAASGGGARRRINLGLGATAGSDSDSDGDSPPQLSRGLGLRIAVSSAGSGAAGVDGYDGGAYGGRSPLDGGNGYESPTGAAAGAWVGGGRTRTSLPRRLQLAQSGNDSFGLIGAGDFD